MGDADVVTVGDVAKEGVTVTDTVREVEGEVDAVADDDGVTENGGDTE